MGQLWVISVTGAIPHSACFFDYTDIKYADGWLGFAPAKHRSPGWPKATPGKVFTDSEEYRLNHGIIFEVPDSWMARAHKSVAEQYQTKDYKLGVCDCVSLSADVARECGLGVPLVNFTPYGLIVILAVWNQYVRMW